jgi:Integrase zinc binding domain
MELPLRISHNDIVKAQNEDAELQLVVGKSLSADDGEYFTANDLVFRRFFPSTASLAEPWLVKNQLWVPPPYRLNILKFAHDSQMSAHPGVRKTMTKIKDVFFLAENAHRCHPLLQTLHRLYVGRETQSKYSQGPVETDSCGRRTI